MRYYSCDEVFIDYNFAFVSLLDECIILSLTAAKLSYYCSNAGDCFNRKRITDYTNTLWCMVFMLCSYYKISIEDVLQANYDKLSDRKARNVIGGSGDNR